ncbi:MAG: hypothetical protein HY709_00895 [Candidatus Latescibacteria bacterium]|nr:hypothetical protein [Candidatus Latescibacterota bacterium]
MFLRIVLLSILALATDLAATIPELHPVRVELLANVATVNQGETLTLGVLFRLKPGWHIYWKNPGDAGLPTSVRFILPEGWGAGQLRWPVPMRFDQPGDIVGYGYADSVLMTVRVTVPEKLSSGSVAIISADVTWLCCEKVCLPGQTHLELKLPVAQSSVPANRSLFTAWERRLPVDADAVGSPFTTNIRGNIPTDATSGTFAVVLHWKAPPGRIEWFPTSIVGLKLDRVSFTTEGNQTHLTFTVRVMPGQKLSVDWLETLVVYTDATGERRGVNVPVRLRGPTSGG